MASKMEELKVQEELLSFHAMNPFIGSTSSARSYMSSSHVSQSITLMHGEERIIQTGVEKQFAGNTFNHKADEDFRVLGVIPRYRGIAADTVNDIVSYIILGQNLESGEYDVIDVPYYNNTHVKYGFVYNWNHDVLNNLRPESIIPKGTILADSPTVSGYNSSWKGGRNVNLALLSLPETTEDGIVMSESCAEKFAFKSIETKTIEFGSTSFPLNLYGDEEHYKPFPEIGELINEDAVLMVLRDYDSRLSPALTSRKDVMEYDPIFDKAVYVKEPGSEVVVCGEKHKTGRVIDIRIYANNKHRKNVYTGTCEIIDKYITGMRQYHDDILAVYEKIKKDHYNKYRNNLPKLSNRLHRLIIESMAISGTMTGRLGYSYKNQPLDIFRVEIDIEYTNKLKVGNKCSDLYGSKGVIVTIWPDDKMPFTVDEFGNKTIADIVMEPSSLVSRMNVGRLYEHFFMGASRRCRALIRHCVGNQHDITRVDDNKVMEAFDILLNFIKVLENEQYTGYLSVKDDINKVREIISDCVNKDVYMLYRVSSQKPAWKVVKDLEGTIYYPELLPVQMKNEDGKIVEMKNRTRIAPIYEFLLNKTADEYLAVAGAKVNHYGLPINAGSAGKDRMPQKGNAVRNLSETETRLFLAYGSRKLIAELKDRANSIPTHRAVYKNILDAEYPTNIDDVVNRNIHPYGEDSALQLINNIFNPSGISIEYTPEEKTW